MTEEEGLPEDELDTIQKRIIINWKDIERYDEIIDTFKNNVIKPMQKRFAKDCMTVFNALRKKTDKKSIKDKQEYLMMAGGSFSLLDEFEKAAACFAKLKKINTIFPEKEVDGYIKDNLNLVGLGESSC